MTKEWQERRKSIDAYARVRQLEAERAALLAEVTDRLVYDYLKALSEGFRQLRLASHGFYWAKTQPDFWPHFPKLRAGSDKVTAYAWIDRNPLDEHRKLFRVYEDGLILVGPGFVLPDDYSDAIRLLEAQSAERLIVFTRVARAVIHRPVTAGEDASAPPYDTEELRLITRSFLGGY